MFWANAKKVVGLKISSLVEQRKKAIMDEQLDKMMGQTEKYSKMLALNLKPEGPEKVTAAAITSTSTATASAAARNVTSTSASGNGSAPRLKQPLVLEAPPPGEGQDSGLEAHTIAKQKSVSFAETLSAHSAPASAAMAPPLSVNLSASNEDANLPLCNSTQPAVANRQHAEPEESDEEPAILR